MWRGWRLMLGLLIVGTVVTAQFVPADDWFPLGTLGQYAHPRPPDGEVVNTYVTATTTDGDVVAVELTAQTAGVARVELETHLDELHDDPSMLEAIAVTWEAGHRGVELASITVWQRIERLENGALAGPPQEHEILTWDLP